MSIQRIRVLLLDPDDASRLNQKSLLETWNFEVGESRDAAEALEFIKKHEPAIVISDLVTPQLDGLKLLQSMRDKGMLETTSFVVLSSHADINAAVEAVKLGASDYLSKPVDVVRLKVLLEKISKTIANEREMRQLKDKVRKLGTFGRLNGSTPQMKSVFKQIQVIAPTSAYALIVGESGVGKELLAKAIHQNSKRHDKPYIAINCAAIPEALLEAELFGKEHDVDGHSVREPGAFELADKGTLFLDEIAEVSLDLQSKILRVLEGGTLRHLGGKTEFSVDIRVIAATTHDLEQAVDEGTFREDLFYRLNVFSIKVPALRERAEDIPLLALTFVHEFNLKNDRHVHGFSHEALNLLKKYSWSGNVRELKNVVERAVVVCKGDTIEVTDLPEALTSKAKKAPTVEFRLGQTMDDVERDFLFHTLSFVDGNKTKAARMLNISLKTLHNKLAKYKSSV